MVVALAAIIGITTVQAELKLVNVVKITVIYT